MCAVSGFVSRYADIPVVSPGLYTAYFLVFLKKSSRNPITKTVWGGEIRVIVVITRKMPTIISCDVFDDISQEILEITRFPQQFPEITR
jgi:hypothetical protein